MKHIFKLIGLFTISFAASSLSLVAEETDLNPKLEQGKELAFDRKKGNCLACHYVKGGTLMGTTGPALIAMKARFPDREKLVTQIADARIKNKNTFMPPFGAHGILTKEEIDLVVDWLLTL